MQCFQSVLSLFPKQIADEINQIVWERHIFPEEIRIRRGRPVCIRAAREEFYLSGCICAEDIAYVILTATNGSFHSSQETIKQGYLPLKHGARLGFCGEAANSYGEIRNIRNISSICIRIAHEIPGCADEVYPVIAAPRFQNTIIVAPPGIGKTTFLRELIRLLSVNGHYIGVVDERGEIAGMYQGKAEFDLGPRSDVSVGIPKPRSAMMLLKSMAPDVLAMDEITAAQDTPAIMEAIGCGVGLLTTMHGRSLADLKKPSFSKILEERAFEYAVFIENGGNGRTYHVERLNE